MELRKRCDGKPVICSSPTVDNIFLRFIRKIYPLKCIYKYYWKRYQTDIFELRKCKICGKKQIRNNWPNTDDKWIDLDDYEWRYPWEQDRFKNSIPCNKYGDIIKR